MIQDHTHFHAAKAYRGDVAGRVTRFVPMVRKMAWHLAGSAGPSFDVEDLMQAGLLALTECAQKHDGPNEDGFAAYAKLRVRGAMVDLLRSASPEVRGARERRRRIEQAQQELHARLGRAPRSAETAAALGLSLPEYEKMRADCAPVRLDSIEECYSDSSSQFADTDDTAETRLLQREDRARLAQEIAQLPERLQLVIQLYFVEELNLSEIAAVLGVSIPRVHQLKAAALEKLRLSLAD
jgi:RNA polymerase sigma factor for flagellar operon FliA